MPGEPHYVICRRRPEVDIKAWEKRLIVYVVFSCNTISYKKAAVPLPILGYGPLRVLQRFPWQFFCCGSLMQRFPNATVPLAPNATVPPAIFGRPV